MGAIRDFINKDIKYENETKRTIVALRILYIVEFVAFILDIAISGIEVIKMYPFRIFALFLANILLFAFTYHSKTRTSLILFILFLVCYINSMIPCFGWSAGMQNYFIIILMLCFFAMYGKTVYKFMYAGFVLIVRIITIGIYGGLKPQGYISFVDDKLLQITNISAVFISIIFISYVFSQKENEAENKLMKYNNQLKKEANTDQLTGLFNRRRAYDYLKEVRNVTDASFVSVAMGDIDFFKKVNDTYGHDAGDEVLRAVADIMRAQCRSTSVISRWGGEEFLIILPECNGDNAFIAIERLRNAVQKNVINVDGTEIKVTMTFGIAEFGITSNIDGVIKEADEKLYYGKTHGRNQVIY